VYVPQPLPRDFLLFLATDEACLPRAVRVDFGKCAIVRFLFAGDAAFLMFFFAAVLCRFEATVPHSTTSIRTILDAHSPNEGSFKNSRFAPYRKRRAERTQAMLAAACEDLNGFKPRSYAALSATAETPAWLAQLAQQ
jgi:hypothetical protein